MSNPHANLQVLGAGKSLKDARAAMIMIHGRGATAESILSLAENFTAQDFAYLAPQAANNTWYPYSFLMPIEQNEPFLTSALRAIGNLTAQVEQLGIPPERTILLGFSQGACLALEFAARNARRYGGVVGLSGGVIGPDGTPRDYPGSLAGTPVFIGCSDIDNHIPLARVHETTEVMRALGAEVTERIYPNMGHTINNDEIEFINQLMAQVAGA